MTIEEKIISDLMEGIKSWNEDTKKDMPDSLKQACVIADNYIKKPKTFNRVIKWVEDLAKKDGFTEAEIKPCTLDGFTKITKSKKALRLIRLAYYRGWKRGVKSSEEARQIMELR